MKRHPYLQPLSRHHHHTLLAVLLLRKGIQKKVAVPVMQQFIQTVFSEEVLVHFQLEEEKLLPVMAEEAEVCELILHEHAELRQLYHEVTATDATADLVQAFANLLEQHIRNEERIYFPLFEQRMHTLSDDVFSPALPEMSGICTNFKPAFWE